MKVAVVTPYYKEEERIIRRCVDSVAKQNYPHVMHVLVSDGFEQEWVSRECVHHIRMPNTADTGDTPRLVGSAYASALGADAIIFVDADCWINPEHVEKMVEAQRLTGAGIVTCPRHIWDKFTDEYMGVDTESDGRVFNDTNCYLVMRPVYRVIANWSFKPMSKGLIGDRFFWEACLRAGTPIARTPHTMTNYSSDFVCHYKMFDKPVPPEAKVIEFDGEQFRIIKWKDKV